MAIKSDKWIKDMAEGHGMIEPFQYDQVKQMVRVQLSQLEHLVTDMMFVVLTNLKSLQI